MKAHNLESKILSRLVTYTEEMTNTVENYFISRELNKACVASAKKIHTHMTQNELNTLYNLGRGLRKSAKGLEIGSYLGASTCYIAAALSLQNGHLFCVDTWENQTMPEGERDTFAEFNQNINGVANYISIVRKNSKDITIADVVYPLDFIFIDGDHSYDGVKNDYEKVASWVTEGGIIAFHDCTYFESVSRVIGEILATGSWQLGGNIDSLVWLRKVGKEHYCFPNPMSSIAILNHS